MKITCRPVSARMRRFAGFSLIELMVAMVISLILMSGVISVFISSKRSYSTNTAVAQVQESGRFAFSFLAPEIRMAGYMGCTKLAHTSSILNGGITTFNFSQGIGGYEYSGTSPGNTYTGSANGWTPTLDSTISSLSPTPLSGSDVLVIYSTNGNPISVNQFNYSNDTFKLQNSTPTAAGLYNGEIGVITDCEKADVFQMTNTTGSQVQHSKNNTMIPGNATGKFPDQFGSNAQLVFPDTYVFYVGTGSDGLPSLYEADLNGGGGNTLMPKEIVSGVDNMQILYGVDPTGSGVPAYYTTADNVNAGNLWPNVLSVQVGLLVRSGSNAVTKPTTAPTYNVLGTLIQPTLDTSLRHVFTDTIGIRNRLP